MAERSFYFTIDKGWWSEFEKFKKAMLLAGLAATEDFPSAVGCSNADLSKFAGDKRNDTKHSTIAGKIITALRGQPGYVVSELPVALKQWNALESARHKLADDLAAIVKREREAQAKRAIDDLNAWAAGSGQDSAPGDPPVLASTPAKQEDADPWQQTGKTTGPHVNPLDELFYAKAEWQETNLGPDGSPYLQVQLTIEESSIRDHSSNSVLRITMDSVRCYVVLDGAQAQDREQWDEYCDTGPARLNIRRSPAWQDVRPAYLMRNPDKQVPIRGRFGFFNLCEVSGPVGESARLEFNTPIDGLTIELPDTVAQRLDQERRSEFEMPEHKLLEGWLRRRAVPSSRVTPGGLLVMASINLNKAGPQDG